MWFVLVTFSLSTSQYTKFWPVKNALKIFLASMFFFGIHVSTAYRSYLINVLTEPRSEEQIRTLEMAKDVGLQFEVSQSVALILKEKDDQVILFPF
jgi:hypothetical protein